MALTKVTGQVIKDTTDVTVGVLTVTNTLAVGGTVSIGGTLTYEDVTNVDAVGLITARNGIVVGSGITLSKDGDIFATGITTVSGNVKVGSGITLSPDGDIFAVGFSSLGTGSDGGVEIFHDGTSRLSSASYGIAVNGNITIAEEIVHGGDTNTKIRFPAADTITAETSGSERLRIESAGNIGIGTDNANNLLHVYGGQIKAQTSTDDTNTDVDLIRAQCGSGGSALFAIRAADAADDNSDWDIKTNAGEELSFTIGGAAEKLRIKSNGNVGIGTSVPDNLLEIFKGSTGTYLKMGGDDAQNGRALTFTSGDTASVGALHTLDAISGNGAIALATAGAERMRVIYDGKVGINSTTPAAKLDVAARGDTEIGIRLTDSNDTEEAPYIEVIGRRADGNSSQAFSGKLHLA